MRSTSATHIKPGDAANAIAFKPDPNFPDPTQPHRIQLITVGVANGKDHQGRNEWMEGTRRTLDWKALAALLD